VLLTEADSLALWKESWQAGERVFLTRAGLAIGSDTLRLTSANAADLTVGIYPAATAAASAGTKLESKTDGVFQRFTPPAPKPLAAKATIEPVQPAGPPREILLGKISRPVAAAPEDPDFDNAAVWRVKLPAGLDLGADPLLRLHFVGDVIRVTLDGKLITDDFYNGNPVEVGLRRHAPQILTGDLRVAILPLRKDAPIYMAKEARPDFGEAPATAELKRVEIVPRYRVELRSSGETTTSSR
jgi:hypothetical protein